MTPKKSKTDPEIIDLPPQRMAVVHAVGAPSQVFPKVMPALYGSVYTLRFDRKRQGLPVFKVSGLRGRYPDLVDKPQEQWLMEIGLPVPEDTAILPQKDLGTEVTLETWRYGSVGQILHLGGYDQEEESVARLQRFITDEGYRVSGVHEEEYVTRPDAKTPKTIIRYPVVRQGKD
jgi:hypothetical protein